MSVWACIIAAALAINGALFGATFLWAKIRAERAMVDRDAEYRALFALEPLPPPGEQVELLTEDTDGAPSTRAAWHLLHLGWIDAVTLLPIKAKPVGWRRHPFPAPPPSDPDTWSDERLQAELAKLAPK